MMLSVDSRLCSGHGRCYSVASGLLEPDDEGFVSIRGDAIAVPAEQQEAGRAAADACPEQAIKLSYRDAE
jgi:ferredoxin